LVSCTGPHPQPPLPSVGRGGEEIGIAPVFPPPSVGGGAGSGGPKWLIRLNSYDWGYFIIAKRTTIDKPFPISCRISRLEGQEFHACVPNSNSNTPFRGG